MLRASEWLGGWVGWGSLSLVESRNRRYSNLLQKRIVLLSMVAVVSFLIEKETYSLFNHRKKQVGGNRVALAEQRSSSCFGSHGYARHNNSVLGSNSGRLVFLQSKPMSMLMDMGFSMFASYFRFPSGHATTWIHRLRRTKSFVRPL